MQRTFSDYLLAIRARWKLALLIAVAAAGSFFYFQSQQRAVYEAQALLRFSLGSNLAATGDRGPSRSQEETALRNFLMDMTGAMFRHQIIDSFTEEERDLITRDYIDLDTGERPAVGSIYRQALDLSQHDPRHFRLSFRHRNPEAAQLLVLRFVDEFKQYLADLNRKQNEDAIRFMRLQVEEFRLKVERGGLELQKYQQDHGVVLDERKNYVDQRLQELRAALNAQELDLIQYETYVNEIESAREEGRPLQELPFIREYGQVASFVSNLVAMRQQRENLAVRYGSRHPQMVQNAAAIRAAEKGLEEAIREAVNKVRIDHEAKKRTVARLREEVADQEAESERLDSLRIEYANMQTRVGTDNRLYQEMLQRQNEMQIQARLSGPQMEMVDGGGVPTQPVSPDQTRILAMTGVMFLGLLLGFPLAMEFIDGRLRTRQAVEEVLGRNYLGQIPKISRRSIDPYEVALEGKPRNVIESLRIVHSQFHMAVPSGDSRVIVVTSLIPGEGKSFLSLSLAALMAKHHRQVLVIDCDLRRPTLLRGLKGNGRSLRRVREVRELPRADSDAPAVIEEVIEGLHVLGLGQNPEDPTEIFEDARFKQMVQRFRNEYDMVILDTPPAGVFSDAALLGSLSDGYIAVLRHNTHSVRKVRNVMRDLEKNNVGVMGIVFNKVVGKFVSQTDDYHRGKYYAYYAKGAGSRKEGSGKGSSRAKGSSGKRDDSEEKRPASAPVS